MATAPSINFLASGSQASALTPSWRVRLWQWRFGRRLLSSVPDGRACYGMDGGFYLEQRLSLPRSAWLVSASLTVLAVCLAVQTIVGVGGQKVQTMAAVAWPAIRFVTPSRLALTTPVHTEADASINVKQEPVKPVTSPSSNMTTTAPTPPTLPPTPTPAQPQLKREVFGFLPYWLVDKVASLHYEDLSTLAYFGVEVNPDGTLNHDEPGWSELQDSKTQQLLAGARAHGVRTVITYRAFDADQIASIVNDPTTRSFAIGNMIAVAKDQHAMGANIDFENVEQPDDTIRNNFSSFVKEATERFHAEIPGSEVSVSTYAASVRWRKLYDIPALSQAADALFVMAYDFHTTNSSVAEPVAPLHGFPGTYWYDVTTTVSDYLTQAPADKIILGVPYYGYDWPTAQDGPGPVSFGSANTSSYDGSIHDPENTDQTRRWDDVADEPYYTYWKDGTWRTTYYEDAQSLGMKYDLVNQQNLRGAGIWALGQEGNAPELWQLVAEKFGQ